VSIKFKKGTFIELEATTTIHLGRLERNLSSGDIIEFDGSSLRIGGEEVSMPELKAGLKRGWLKIPEEGSAPAPANTTTPKQENKASSMSVESVYDEESKVSSVSESASDSVEQEGIKFPVVASAEDEDNYLVGSVSDSSGAQISGASSADDGEDLQDGSSVNLTLKTATQQKNVITDSNAVGQEIDSIENLEGTFSPEIVEQEDDFEVVEELAPEQEETPSEETPSEEAQILEGLEQVPDQGAVEVKDNSKIKVLPSGVEWDMSPHWSKRIKIALELYSDNPEVLEEIKAVEGTGVANGIDKGLAEG